MAISGYPGCGADAMTRRLRVGLTGGIASGKSSAAQRFLELGVPVIDADESARRVVAPGTPGLAEVVREFGVDILDLNGALDRRRLRNLIFSEPTKRLALESILHPLIRADMEQLVQLAAGSYVVVAIPLLVERSSFELTDRILVVDLPIEIQVARVVARDGGTSDQARAILAAQASRDARMNAADDIIDNTGTLSQLRQRVDDLHHAYIRLAAGNSN